MKKAVVLVFLLIVSGVIPGYGQIEQRRRQREKMQRAVQAERDRINASRGEQMTAIPKPKAAVMNVDVQVALAKTEHNSFAEAKPKAVNRISDGDVLWLYIKFNGKLGDYVMTSRDPENPGSLHYRLYAEIGPQGDISALSRIPMKFTKEDLELKELKINLAPGLHGRNRSIPVFLDTAGNGKPGLWNNEFRLTNTPAIPRSLDDNLAKMPIVLDFTRGTDRYRQMETEYDSIVLRGSTDARKMPIPGRFVNDDLKSRIVTNIRFEGIKPVRVYFSGDAWAENASFGVGSHRSRKIFATYTYQKGKSCFYGLAAVEEPYDFVHSKFGEAEIKLQNDFPIPCTDLN